MGWLNFIFGNTPIYKKDAKSGGYVAHYKEHKGIRGQGLTKKEALESLNRDVEFVTQLRTKKQNEGSEYSTHKPRVAHSR
jgi:predicted RNase H-like HicB family nuclease